MIETPIMRFKLCVVLLFWTCSKRSRCSAVILQFWQPCWTQSFWTSFWLVLSIQHSGSRSIAATLLNSNRWINCNACLAHRPTNTDRGAYRRTSQETLARKNGISLLKSSTSSHAKLNFFIGSYGKS